MPDDWLPISESLSYHDVLKDRNYTRSMLQVQASGLYVKLGPWDFHFFTVGKER